MLNQQEISIKETRDKFFPKTYVIVEGKSVNKLSSDEIAKIKALMPESPILAQVGSDVTIKMDEQANKLLIIRDAKAQEVRQYILGDARKYNHKIEFKLAEYHGYIRIAQFNDQQEEISHKQYGAAVIPKGAKVGRLIIRDDEYYDKYWKGNQTVIPGTFYPKKNKASFSVAFDLTQEQYENLTKIIATDIKTINNGNESFIFFAPQFIQDLGLVSSNCHDYSVKIFQDVISATGSHFDYVKIDETRLNDQGVMFLAMDYSTLGFLNNVGLFLQTVIGPESTLDYQVIPEIDYPELLRMDANAKNESGQIPLGILAGMPPSPEKYTYMKLLIEKTNDINTPEIDNTAIPLTNAVKANDQVAVEILLNAGADSGFIDDVGDSLVDVALIYGANKVVDELYHSRPDLMYRDNGEHQFPIAKVCNNIENYDKDNFGDLCLCFDRDKYFKSDDELNHIAV